MTNFDTPFGIVYASKDIAFVADFEDSALGVLNTSKFLPTLIRQISIPQVFSAGRFAAEGLAISSDKRTLYIASGPGAIAIDVAAAIAPDTLPILGELLRGLGDPSPVLGGLMGNAGTSAIEVTLSPADDYLFMSQEDGNSVTNNTGAIEVFKVQRSQN